MIIAITALGKELKDQLDCRFGRAKYIIVYNTENSTFKVHDNNTNLNAAQGAGIQTAQNIINLEAEALITGNCGPKAFTVLNAGNVKIFKASSAAVKDVIQLFSDNKLEELTNPNVEGHWS